MSKINTQVKGLDTDQAANYKIDIADSINLAKEAVEICPDDAEIWYERGNINFAVKSMLTGAEEQVLKCYQKAYDPDPKNPLYQEKIDLFKNNQF